ncbi:hypothetical protein [Streptomyces sp. NPDC096153]|uniref:hypothetical protein n=1 Tax=Streptomyces sp. NPDC096153 TaxID=3155548 RepID=UPI003331FCBB
MNFEPPEYLPLPAGLADRARELLATGEAKTEEQAWWMAACEAIGAVARRETNDAALFWYGDLPDEQREVWDRIADREGKRHYFHQQKDTLVGYLACSRHKARTSLARADDTAKRFREQRDLARSAAVALEQENAHLIAQQGGDQ